MGMARVSDICLMMAPSNTEPQQRDILLDMLFGSGVPLLLVPKNWKKRGLARRAVVAWDGSACAARAVRDALPLLAYAKSVEVLSVLGEKNIGAENFGHRPPSGASLPRSRSQCLADRPKRDRGHLAGARDVDGGRHDGHGGLWSFPSAGICLGRRDARHIDAHRSSNAAIALRATKPRRCSSRETDAQALKKQGFALMCG